MNDGKVDKVRVLWEEKIREIRGIEDEMEMMTPNGRAQIRCEIRYSRMLEVFGFDTRTGTGSLDDFEYVLKTIEKIKADADFAVNSMNTWLKENAEKYGTRCWTMASESAEELIVLWSRGVIERYVYIANQFMLELNGDSSRTFKECFPVLNAWNIKQTDKTKNMDWCGSGTPLSTPTVISSVGVVTADNTSPEICEPAKRQRTS